MEVQSKILVVDDIEMNRAMLAKIFKDEFIVFEAANGQEAMRQMYQNDLDLVLLDLSMPIMDGYEVIRAMKAEQKLAAIPIIVTTGAIDKSERKAFDLGADDFIVKPFDPYIVKKRVVNLIDKYILQVENLKQALGQAEQLNEVKSQFFSRVSHEIRTPINSIISMTSLLKGQCDNQTVVEKYREKIEDASKYLLGVINDILDMSAIENQQITITKGPFDFKKLIEETASIFYGQCKEKGLNFHMNLTNFTEEYLFGDPLRLKEVLVNLISNAIKFTPKNGNIMIKVSQTSRIDNMIKLKFAVIDDGEGIEASRQAKIFEPFVQESGDTSLKHGGSGLGLPIVKNIVELMGGSISLHSEKWQGSTFVVELPFNVAKEMPQITSDKLKQVRALIVDDDSETQEYGRKVLAKMGIQCDCAKDGNRALTMMREAFNHSQGYDICFIDWRMPKMSGIEITRAIRDIFDDDTIIVVASAYDVEQISREAIVAGANLVVPKPMFQSTVFNLLMNITGGQYQQASPESEKYNFVGKHLLIAEDNTLNAEVVMELTTMVGFTVQRASDGEAVCRIFQEAPVGTYDGILMDIQMPYKTGLEATQVIRQSKHPQAKTIPIIAVSANAFTDDVKAAYASGMNGHVAKPIDTGRLYRILDKVIGQTERGGLNE